ncbi:Zinc finger protein [Melia azedarach]|uniref:Zinc finger protein n=1 Tax=Melia azedarach TaxID=155640 RepID=A0ACC1YU09_MELAZ|nr:Zinc finger protein [Melia azedarach]
MEKHKCKLCFKNFSNGRALGGHMRSHMLNLPINLRKHEEEEEEEGEPGNQLSDDTESASSPSSSSSPSEDEEGEEKGLFYGLRENPRRSIRLVDPEFSFAVDAGSVVLQDRESETESSKNPTRRRSKRTRKFEHQYQQQQQEIMKKLKFSKLSKTESWVEPEPMSSISDTTTEEDVAFCLMMLSRDKWKRREKQNELLLLREEEEEAAAAAVATEKSMEETDESEEFKSFKNRSRGKYKCETCKKVFKSYQALGGHRASHKKIKFYTPSRETELEQENAGASTSVVPMVDKKIHECPVCFRVFSSGQALGGHKRTHVTGLVASSTSAKSSTKLGENLIDLNLPAPIDDDDISQIELSAVSDAEFVNHIKR